MKAIVRNGAARPRSGPAAASVKRPDWRGWIALAWVLWWGWAYIQMVFHARSPQILASLRSWTEQH
jgi:hypothetical protein